MGEIASPTIRSVYNVSATGKPLVLPGVGGITYNLRVGDPACGWEADHVEPCVSAENKENDGRSGKQQTPLSTYYHALETSVKALYRWRGCSHKLKVKLFPK